MFSGCQVLSIPTELVQSVFISSMPAAISWMPSTMIGSSPRAFASGAAVCCARVRCEA